MARNHRTKNPYATIVQRKETLHMEQSGDRVLILRSTRAATYQARMPEKDRWIAQLCVALIEQYGYAMSAIRVRNMIRVDEAHDQRKYIEADIIVRGSEKTPSLIIETLGTKSNQEKAWRNLFFMGRAVQREMKGHFFLVVCVRASHESQVEPSCKAVNFRAFPTFSQWSAAGMPHTACIPYA